LKHSASGRREGCAFSENKRHEPSGPETIISAGNKTQEDAPRRGVLSLMAYTVYIHKNAPTSRDCCRPHLLDADILAKGKFVPVLDQPGRGGRLVGARVDDSIRVRRCLGYAYNSMQKRQVESYVRRPICIRISSPRSAEHGRIHLVAW
jgi:hypothetical protein